MGTIAVIAPVFLGILFALRPKVYWWLWRGWTGINSEPTDMELWRGRIVGVILAVMGLFGLCSMLTN